MGSCTSCQLWVRQRIYLHPLWSPKTIMKIISSAFQTLKEQFLEKHFHMVVGTGEDSFGQRFPLSQTAERSKMVIVGSWWLRYSKVLLFFSLPRYSHFRKFLNIEKYIWLIKIEAFQFSFTDLSLKSKKQILNRGNVHFSAAGEEECNNTSVTSVLWGGDTEVWTCPVQAGVTGHPIKLYFHLLCMEIKFINIRRPKYLLCSSHF